MTPERRSLPSTLLIVLGIGFVISSVTVSSANGPTTPPGILALAATAILLLHELVPRRMSTARLALAAGMIVLAAPVCPATDGVALVPALIGVGSLVGRLARSVALVIAVVAGTVALVAAGAVADGSTLTSFLSMAASVVVVALATLSRRQAREAQRQREELRAEQAIARAAADRAAIARDIHDVLAHSLGGLVVQLDAVSATLEAGRVEDATARVERARGLAVSGLAEARRAVAALRDDTVGGPTPPVPPWAFDEGVADLIDAHRGLGGTARLTVDGHARELGGPEAAALTAALREGLSNARKHAQGAPVDVSLRWGGADVELSVRTPSLAAGVLAATGGGYGLRGLAERAAALRDAEFTVDDDAEGFRVRMRTGTA